RVGIEADGVLLGAERRRFAERLAQLGQRLAQAGSRLFLAAIAPQQRHELLAGPWRAGGNRETGQKGADLPADPNPRPVRAGLQLEAAKQPEPNRSESWRRLVHTGPGRGRNPEFADYSRVRPSVQTPRLRRVCGSPLQCPASKPRGRRLDMDPVFG